MRYLLASLLLVSGALSATAQYTGDSLYFLLPKDTVTLSVHQPSGSMVFDHYLAPNQSVYGLTRFYGVQEEDFYALRPGLKKGYDPGDIVRVPIGREVIRRDLPADSLAWFVPVRYTMQPGETLFGLATRRLNWLNDAPLRALNPDLDVQKMKPGAVINIGYMTIAGLPARKGANLDPLAARNRGLANLYTSRSAGKNMIQENGKAAWRKKGNNFMVLHRTAPQNSIIEIHDPRSRKTVYARVVGPIPEQVYPPDVMLVVSHLIMKTFNVRDKNFYVRTSHF